MEDTPTDGDGRKENDKEGWGMSHAAEHLTPASLI